ESAALSRCGPDSAPGLEARGAPGPYRDGRGERPEAARVATVNVHCRQGLALVLQRAGPSEVPEKVAKMDLPEHRGRPLADADGAGNARQPAARNSSRTVR